MTRRFLALALATLAVAGCLHSAPSGQTSTTSSSYDPIPKLPYSHRFEATTNGTYIAIGFHLSGHGRRSDAEYGHAEWNRSPAVYAESFFIKWTNGRFATKSFGRDEGGTSCHPDNSASAAAIADCPLIPQEGRADARGYSTMDAGNYTILVAFFGADHVAPMNVPVAADYPLDDLSQCEGTTRLFSTAPADDSPDRLNQTLTFTTNGRAFVQVEDYIPGTGFPAVLDVRNGTAPFAHFEALHSLVSNERYEYMWNETRTGTLADTIAFGVGAGNWTLSARMAGVEGVPPGAVVGVVDDPCFVASDGILRP